MRHNVSEEAFAHDIVKPLCHVLPMWLLRGGGQGADWVVLGLDPACPEPDTELQMRAAVLLVLTWDIKAQSGIRHIC